MVPSVLEGEASFLCPVGPPRWGKTQGLVSLRHSVVLEPRGLRHRGLTSRSSGRYSALGLMPLPCQSCPCFRLPQASTCQGTVA